MIDIGEIREEFEYSCYRISLAGHIGDSEIPMKVDISAGDSITPQEVTYIFDLLLEDRMIEVWAYNLETVLAEKMETIISRDITNTRMRDFYDIYILTTTRRNDFDVRTLKTALERTTAKRETELNYDELAIDLYRIFSDKGLMKLWTNYQKKFTYSQDISWKLIEEKIMELFNGICVLK